MTKTEFLIGRIGLEFDDDFYPNELPEDWYFDHYSSRFKALALHIDTDEDLEYIFETIHDDLGDYFELALILEETSLNNEAQLSRLLLDLEEYRDNVTLWCRVSAQPKPASLKLLENYKLCLQSEASLKSQLSSCEVLGQNLAYTDSPVLVLEDLTELELVSNELLKKMKDLPRAIIICASNIGDSLNHMQSISLLINQQ